MVNFGVIGCGKIGIRHLTFLKEMDGIRIQGVCDVVPERLEKASTSFDAQGYSNYTDLINDPSIDVVNVCTPSGLHPQISIDALNAGKHVICEKPMALSISDCKKMIEASKNNKKHLFVVKQNRFNRPITILMDALRKGMFGKVYSINCNVLWNRRDEYFEEEKWRGTKELDGGALYTQASHFADLIQLIGGPIKSVFAKTDTFLRKVETEDTGSIIITFESGALGTMYYTNCTYNKNMEGSITVLGEKGSVKIGGEYLNKIEHWNVEGYPLPEDSEEMAPANDYGSYRGTASNHSHVFRECIKKIIGDPESNIVHGEEGKKSVDLIEAVHLSAKTGKEVFFPLDESLFESKSNLGDIQNNFINSEEVIEQKIPEKNEISVSSSQGLKSEDYSSYLETLRRLQS